MKTFKLILGTFLIITSGLGTYKVFQDLFKTPELNFFALLGTILIISIYFLVIGWLVHRERFNKEKYQKSLYITFGISFAIAILLTFLSSKISNTFLGIPFRYISDIWFGVGSVWLAALFLLAKID